MKTSKLSKELKVVISEFVVYPTEGRRQPLLIRFTIHLAYTLRKNGESVLLERKQTNCIIKNYINKRMGATICGPDDEFDEVTGMKIALTRTLKGMQPQATRSQIWAAFHAWVRENYEVKK